MLLMTGSRDTFFVTVILKKKSRNESVVKIYFNKVNNGPICTLRWIIRLEIDIITKTDNAQPGV